MSRIAWIGTGKLGTPLAVCMATKHKVVAYDISPPPWEKWPHRELGPNGWDDFQKWLDRARGATSPPSIQMKGSLTFAPTLSFALEMAELIFVCVQTPHDQRFEGITRLPDDRADFDYSYLKKAVADICEFVRPDQTIVIVSTVLPGTTRRELLPLTQGKCGLVYNPAFPAMGTVMADFMHPEFVLLGTNCDSMHERKVLGFYVDFYSGDLRRDMVGSLEMAELIFVCVQTPHDQRFEGITRLHRVVPIHSMSYESAELAKCGYNCYSDDTDVMTTDGWKRFVSLTGEERILSLNPVTMVAEWSDHSPLPPYHCDEMIHFRNKIVDLLVTPNHNMFVGEFQPRKPGPRSDKRYLDRKAKRNTIYSDRYKWKILPAASLCAGAARQLPKYIMRRTSEWVGDQIETVTIASNSIPAHVYARFMGWYLAEGSVNQHSVKSWSVHVSQMKDRTQGESKWEECGEAVRSVCEVLCVPMSESDRGFCFYHAPFAQYLAGFGTSLEKYVPEIIKESQFEVISAFLEAYMAGDGCDTDNGTYYSTSSPRMASDLGELIVKTGKMPSYRTVLSSISGRPCHIIYPTFKPQFGLPEPVRVKYRREVYCTQLEKNHVMLVRRNGRCSWSGNCAIGQKIVLANSIMEICHKVPHADVDHVTGAMKAAHRRITGPAYMDGGMGDGGGCHPRDCIAMSWLACELSLSYDPFERAMVARERQARWLVDLVQEESRVGGLPIVLLGKSYKPESNLTTGSPALLVADILKQRYVSFGHHDPHVDGAVVAYATPGVFLICTKHKVFEDYEFPEGSVVIDPFRFLKPQDGVRIISVGKGEA